MFLSHYCSDLFTNTIFPAYCLRLKTAGAVNTHMLSVNMICDHLKKDFLDITHDEVQGFFDGLSSGHIKSKQGRAISKNTIMTRFACLRPISAFALALKILKEEG